MRSMLTAITLITLVPLTGCGEAAGNGPDRAQVMFADNCGTCHGETGWGDRSIAAPNIAGLPDWYVEAQVMKFREGVRGADGDDVAGLRMRPMSRTVPLADVGPLAHYVSSLTPATRNRANKGVPAGDPAAGKAHFGTCAACHGADGKGNKAMSAPPIALLDAWYIESQLHKFRKGIRGAHPKDITGKQMAPMAKTLPNDKAVTDVAAYVSTL